MKAKWEGNTAVHEAIIPFQTYEMQKNPYHHINVVSNYMLPGLLETSHEET